MAERESTSMLMAAWGQVISAGVGIVAAVVAAWIGWLSIQQGELQTEQARTTRTLEFFATFNSQDMVNIRDRLNNEDWCARYEYISDPEYESKISESAIVSLIDFFDAVHRSCPPDGGLAEPVSHPAETANGRSRIVRTCDREFAEELLSPYARDIYPVLSQTVIKGRSRRGPRFGEGIVALADPRHEATIEQVAEGYRASECPVSSNRQTGANVTQPR